MANAGTGITLIKQFTYRGDATEQWSNTYWFRNSGPAAGDDASWLQAFNDVIAAEKLVYAPTSSIVRGYGYNDRTYKSHAVYDFIPASPIPGQLVAGSGAFPVAGDQAAMVFWKTNRKNSRGKWVYLRKYLHDGYISGADQNKLTDAYHASLKTYAAALNNMHGGLVAGPSKTDPTPGLDSIQLLDASPWVTTRTLKRRGKRPRPA